MIEATPTRAVGGRRPPPSERRTRALDAFIEKTGVSLDLGDALKAALGTDLFEEKRENRARSLEAIRAGALARRFYAARVPAATTAV